jgi:hypothetical protein
MATSFSKVEEGSGRKYRFVGIQNRPPCTDLFR